MNKYYCLVAGLPELSFDDGKLNYNLTELKKLLKEELKLQDYKYIELFFRKFDNSNLLKFLKDPESQLDSKGNISADSFAEIVGYFKGLDIPKMPKQPSWFKTFIPAWLEDKPIFPNMSWEDQLTSLYYDSSINCGNEFIGNWFEFNLDVTNIITAINCRNFGLEAAESIVGSNEVANTLRVSTAKDFGISHKFPHLDEVFRIADESNLIEREKKIDLLKWVWLEENSFFKYFSIENIFTYLLQTEIVERWMGLSHEKGNHVFRGFVSSLKSSFDFPEEYKLKK
jgi:hypothetical protein